MNALVPTYHSQLPAFLRDPSLFAETDKAIAGIGGGMPPSISIRGRQFHLIGADGEESHVNQLTLDVIVLGGNEHVSKAYYAGAYDPAQGGGLPPTCFSDNGMAPSVNATTPQAPLCAGCQFNAWGSKVTPTGSQVKACTDSKKLAVVLAVDTPTIVNGAAGMAKALEQVYLLRIPAATMGDWKGYVKEVQGRGLPVTIGVVTHLEFDAQVSYPKLFFKAVKLNEESVVQRLLPLRGSPELRETVGMNDVPRTATAASVITPAATQPAPLPLAPPPAPAALPLAPPPAPAQQQEQVRRTRGRPGAAQPALPPAPAAVAPPAPLFPAQNGSAVIQTPTPAGNELDALLAAALK